MDKILNSNTLVDLAENIDQFLALQDKTSYAALYRALKERCTQYALASLFDNSARHYDTYTGNRCAVMHLYLNWAYTKSAKKNRAELERIANEIKNDFTPAENTQIRIDAIRSILDYLEQRYGSCTKFFSEHRLSILLPECGHKRYNSLCRTAELVDGSVSCSLYLFHIRKDCGASPEYILFHELGHVLHTMLTGSYNTVPESFFEMAEPMFSGLSTAYRDSAPEFFADCFAMGVMLDSEWSAFDPYPQIYAEDKRLFERYMHSFLE